MKGGAVDEEVSVRVGVGGYGCVRGGKSGWEIGMEIYEKETNLGVIARKSEIFEFNKRIVQKTDLNKSDAYLIRT